MRRLQLLILAVPCLLTTTVRPSEPVPADPHPVCIQQWPRPQSNVPIPVATFPARNAPMGVAFVPDTALDKRFQNNAIVALKGSWGTQPSGGMFGDKSTQRPPAIKMVRFTDGTAADVVDVVTGFQRADGQRLARPVGVTIGPDGALYFTSDTHTEGLFRLRSGPAAQ